MIVLEHLPKRKTRRTPTICLVGKGITFDTGGISIKPSAKMEDMKFDMCGGAAVFGLMHLVKALQPAANIHALVPATDNMPDGSAYRPGDIVKARNGKTIEIISTDAEGRLLLCDALAYAAEKKPASLIDLATLETTIAKELLAFPAVSYALPSTSLERGTVPTGRSVLPPGDAGLAKRPLDVAIDRVELGKLGHLRREADLPELSEARLLGAELPAHLRQRESPELQLSLDRIDQVGQAHMVVGREEPEVVQVARFVAGPVKEGDRLLDRHLVQGVDPEHGIFGQIAVLLVRAQDRPFLQGQNDALTDRDVALAGLPPRPGKRVWPN